MRRVHGESGAGVGIDSVRISDPADAAGSDSGDAVGNATAVAEFGFAIREQADERPIDVAVTEEAEVESMNAGSSQESLSPTNVKPPRPR